MVRLEDDGSINCNTQKQHGGLAMMYSRRTERAAFVDAAQWPKWPEIHCQALAKLMMSTRERHEKQKSLLILLLLA
jgi:hypothetical protein